MLDYVTNKLNPRLLLWLVMVQTTLLLGLMWNTVNRTRLNTLPPNTTGFHTSPLVVVRNDATTASRRTVLPSDLKPLTLRIATENLPLAPERARNKMKVHSQSKKWTPSQDSYRYFQPVDSRQAWVYSAFYVENTSSSGQASALGIGLMRIPVPRQVYCHFQFEDKGDFKTQTGSATQLPDSHNTVVVPIFMECPIPDNLRPKFVSFTLTPNASLTNLLPLQYPRPRAYNFTVCFAALFSKLDLTNQLLWSLEANQLLGAQHIFVYNFSLTAKVDAILSHYVKIGLVTVLPWPLPTLESWYWGQMVAINDCLYRNRGLTKYVTVCDTDELIVPSNVSTWMDLVTSIENDPSLEETDAQNRKSHVKKVPMSKHDAINSDKGKAKLPPSKSDSFSETKHAKQIGAFIARTVFFCKSEIKKDWQNIKLQFSISEKEEDFISRFHVSPLQHHSTGVQNILPRNLRSKQIVRPELVRIVGIHYPFEYQTGGRPAYVSVKAGLVHHYRCFERNNPNPVPKTAFRYKTPLLKRLDKMIRQLPNIFKNDTRR